jgi:MraZ protein
MDYSGEFQIKLDEKGRITVPRRIRDIMTVHGHAIWFMTRGFDNCISLYHWDEWKRIGERMKKAGSMKGRALDFRRFLVGGASESRPDQQGRMAVPQHLREFADIDKDAVLVGLGDHLELWNKEAFDGYVKGNEEQLKDLAGFIFGGEEPAETAGVSD